MLEIKNYSKIYENNRTRDLKTVKWIPLPCKLDGDGYCSIMDLEDGPAVFGAWIACLEVVARTKGIFIRSNGEPHSADSLSRITRIDSLIISRMIMVCKEIGWLSDSGCGNVAGIPQGSAGLSHESAVLSCNVMSCNVSVLSLKEESAERGKTARMFEPPSQEICSAYFVEIKSTAEESELFFLYYTANGWMTGRNKIKDWQAAARGWVKRAFTFKRPQQGKQITMSLEQRQKEIEQNGF